MKYICELCGWIYDEEKGYDKQWIPAGTAFQALSPSFECPFCGQGKDAFDPLVIRDPSKVTIQTK